MKRANGGVDWEVPGAMAKASRARATATCICAPRRAGIQAIAAACWRDATMRLSESASLHDVSCCARSCGANEQTRQSSPPRCGTSYICDPAHAGAEHPASPVALFQSHNSDFAPATLPVVVECTEITAAKNHYSWDRPPSADAAAPNPSDPNASVRALTTNQ